MMNLFVRGGSLAALAVALALTAPANAQEMTVQPDDPAPAAAPPPPPRPMRAERNGGPARAEITRPETAPRFERPAPRFERTAEQRTAPPSPVFTPSAPPMRVDPDVEARAGLGPRSENRRGGRRGGFGGEVTTRAETVQREQQEARRVDPRAERPERRPEPPVAQGGWQGQTRGDRTEGRQGGWQGERRDTPPAGTSGGWQGGRRDGAQAGGWQGQRRDGPQGVPPPATTGGWQGDRRDGTQVRGDGRFEGRRDERVDGRREEWRGDRDGRRDDWRRDRDWRRDDWRWNWSGRQGWDNRDFRRWDNRWRDNRSYNWSTYRRSHRVIYQPGPYYAPYRSHRYSRLSIGLYLDSLFFQPRFFINDPWSYRLPPVYGPYQWVRYYDDVLLVDIYSGEVVDVIYDFFW